MTETEIYPFSSFELFALNLFRILYFVLRISNAAPPALFHFLPEVNNARSRL